jgi:hypothetical protein
MTPEAGLRVSIIFVIIAVLLVGAVGFIAMTAPKTSRANNSTSPSTTWTYTSGSASGLELQIRLNATAIRLGESLGARVDLVNTLRSNITLVPDFSANPNIAKWDGYDSICGTNPTDNVVGYAVFQGHYTAENLSEATAPMTLAPPLAIPCPISGFVRGAILKIDFSPGSNLATFHINSSSGYSFHLLVLRMQANITTGRVMVSTSVVTATVSSNHTTTVQTTTEENWGWNGGTSLNGYWATPANRDSCQPFPTNGSLSDYYSNCGFSALSVGSYTIVAEDLWNQTAFAYFQVS